MTDPTQIPLQTDPVKIFRKPSIVFTNGYLNDPIKFTPDPKLFNDSITKQVEGYPVEYERDFSQFLRVEMTPDLDSGKVLAVEMRSPVYKRDNFVDIYDTEFRELING